MPKGLLELRKKRSQVIDEMAQLADKVKAEERLFSDEENEKLQALEEEERSLSAEIEKAVKAEEEQRSRLAAIEGLKGKAGESRASSPEIRVTREEGMDDKGNVIVYRNFGEQLRDVYQQAMNPHVRVAKLERAQTLMRAATGLSEGVAADGGFLLQTQFNDTLMRRTYETGVLASQCRKVTLGANASSLKINLIDESSRVNGSRLGGIRSYWENEGDQITASKTKFKPMEVRPGKLTAAFYATEELLADISSLGQMVSDMFVEEFAFQLDDKILNGEGNGVPLGIMKSGALVTVAKEGSQAADTVVLNNITKMRNRLWTGSRGSSNWYIHQDVEPQLNILSLTVGNNSYPVLMPSTGIAGAPFDTMFARPVRPIEHCATLGDLGDILLLDLSQYLLVEKGGINSSSSVHVRFLFDEQVFKFTYRVGGQPLWDKPLTPFKGSNTTSPFVALAERA